MTGTVKTTEIPVNELHFDKKNPRLPEYGVTLQSSDDEIMKILWDAMDVRELVQSIAASGFFSHEPLIVAAEDGKLVVIEGNRRLAAVKVLLGHQATKKFNWDIPVLPDEQKKQLTTVPVIVTDRRDSWRFLGFKHVNGPAKWGSYAKAKYIADVHRSYGITLVDIANQIGDGHRTVQRLYRGLMVFEQAERENVYNPEDKYHKRFAFSHLYTGLGYDGIRSFLSLKVEVEEDENPVPKEKIVELGELCIWLYGSRKDSRPPVVESQNPDLRRLDAVLNNRQAVAALRAGTDLARAFEISRPPTALFEEALLAAKRELTTARAYLTPGYDKSEALLRIAGTIANMADDIYAEMERKQAPEKKKIRLMEE